MEHGVVAAGIETRAKQDVVPERLQQDVETGVLSGAAGAKLAGRCTFVHCHAFAFCARMRAQAHPSLNVLYKLQPT